MIAPDRVVLFDLGEMSEFDAPRARQMLLSEYIGWLERN
jgi:hypothetical protein